MIPDIIVLLVNLPACTYKAVARLRQLEEVAAASALGRVVIYGVQFEFTIVCIQHDHYYVYMYIQ